MPAKWILAALLATSSAMAAVPPPGVVIDHVPKAELQYIGSPSLAVLPNGDYVASHDLFGPGSDRRTTRVFLSHDRGQTWSSQGQINGQWWSTLFVHHARLYIIGVNREAGAMVIRRSDDAGRTWTTPREGKSGLLSTNNGYLCAPTPVLEVHGRLWRAFATEREDQSFIISAADDADLLDSASWRSSDRIAAKKLGWAKHSLGGKRAMPFSHPTGASSTSLVSTPRRPTASGPRSSTLALTADTADSIPRPTSSTSPGVTKNLRFASIR